MNRMTSIIARTVILAVCMAAAMSCTNNELSAGDAEWAPRSFRLSHHCSADTDAVHVSVDASGLEDTLFFKVEDFTATDQSGSSCELTSAGVTWVKGGTAMFLNVKVDPVKTTSVTVAARLRLNDDVVDIVRGFRRRTPEEKEALNPRVEWTPLLEIEQLTVSEAPRRCSGR